MLGLRFFRLRDNVTIYVYVMYMLLNVFLEMDEFENILSFSVGCLLLFIDSILGKLLLKEFEEEVELYLKDVDIGVVLL